MSDHLTFVVIDQKHEGTEPDTHLGKFVLPAVPQPGERFFIDKKRFRVFSREWHLDEGDFWVHLRVDEKYL
jgi:hypothetical protein